MIMTMKQRKDEVRKTLSNNNLHVDRRLQSFGLVIMFLEHRRAFKFVQVNQQMVERTELKKPDRQKRIFGPPEMGYSGEYINVANFIKNALEEKTGYRLFNFHSKQYIWFSKK